MAIPSGYVRIEAKKFYENVEYYIDTSVTPTYALCNDNAIYPYISDDAQIISNTMYTYITIYDETKEVRIANLTTKSWITNTIKDGVVIGYPTLNINLTTSPEWLYVKEKSTQSIPDGYTRIEPNKLYENVEYYIDTSVTTISSVSSNINTLPFIATITSAGAEQIVVRYIKNDTSLEYKTIYYLSYNSWGTLLENGVFPDIPTVNINLTTSPEWLYVKVSTPEDKEIKKLVNKVYRTDENGNEKILLDVSGTTAIDEVVCKGYIYTRSDGSQGTGTMINSGLNIVYNDTVPSNTNMLWVACDKADKVVVKKEIPTEFVDNNLYIVPSFGDYSLQGSELMRSVYVGYSAYGIASATVDDKVYLFGGKGNEYYKTISVYDPATNTMTVLSTALPKAMSHIATAVVGKKIYLFGGDSGSTQIGIHVFDTETQTIETLTTIMKYAAHSIGCVAVDNKIYLFGGQGTSSYGSLNTICVFNTLDNTIQQLSTKMPNGLNGIAAAELDGIIYLFGGSDDAYNPKKTICAFNIKEETIVGLDVTLPQSLRGMNAVTVHGYIYLLGGTTGSYTINSSQSYVIYKFDGTTLVDTGYEAGSGCDMGAAFVNNKIYTFGGFKNSSTASWSDTIYCIAFDCNYNNIFKLISSDRLDVDISLGAVYYNKKVDAYLYDNDSNKWVNIDTGNARLIMADAIEDEGIISVNAIQNASSYELYEVTEE